jgi:hypothetical protein
MNRTTRRIAATLTAVALLSAGSAATASAAPPSGTPLHPFNLVFPAGFVCNFHLRVIGTNARSISTVVDGNTTTTVLAGNRLTFINMDDASNRVTFPSTTVTVVATTVDADTTLVTTTGGSIILLFPIDKSLSPNQPDGPSAYLHRGQTVFSDEAGDAADTLISAEGPSTDICAAMSS